MPVKNTIRTRYDSVIYRRLRAADGIYALNFIKCNSATRNFRPIAPVRISYLLIAFPTSLFFTNNTETFHKI